MGTRVSFSDQIREETARLGFDAVAIARADVKLDRDFAAYESMVARGMHGEMEWLGRESTRRVRERLDGDGILPGAKSIICVARRYGPGGGWSPPVPGQVARYARGRDYHGFLRRRLRRLAAFVRSLGDGDEPVLARPLCDEEPVLERAWAARAGLGFIGKNGMLIVPGLGSMVLLGEVVTTLELDELDEHRLGGARPPVESRLGGARPLPPNPPAETTAERCGSCTRCLDTCPTSAFVAPFVLDPRRCVSYLTIEHRSAVALELRAGVSDHLFGCDDCQTVCPFNAGVLPRAPLDASDGSPFDPLARWSRVRLEDWLLCDEPGWQALVEGSPLKRAGRSGMARNAAIVLGNRGDRNALPALRTAAASHDDPMVREAAAWAIDRIAGGHGHR
jgi:epoxyqueuosine reductase